MSDRLEERKQREKACMSALRAIPYDESVTVGSYIGFLEKEIESYKETLKWAHGEIEKQRSRADANKQELEIMDRQLFSEQQENKRLREAFTIAKEFHESYERGIADGENAVMAIEEMLKKVKGGDSDE